MTSLSLQTTVSPWGPSIPEEIYYKYPIFGFGNTGSFTQTWGGAGGLVTPGFSIGELDFPAVEIFEGAGSASFNGSWDLDFKLIAELRLAVGSVAVEYNIDLEEVVSNVANTLNAVSYINTANWSVASASINSTGTNPDESSAEIYVAARVGGSLSGSLSAYAEVFDSTIFNETVSFQIIPNFSYSKTALIAGIYPGEALEFDTDYGSLSMSLPSTPALQTGTLLTRGDSYANLSTSGVGDSFFSAALDISGIVANALGVPFTGEWSDSPYPLDASVSWTLVSAELTGDLSLQQTLEFIPGDVDITMVTTFAPTLDTQGNLLVLGETITGKLGDKFEFRTPQGEGTFTVAASYVLDGTLRNSLAIYGVAAFDMAFLGASVDASLDFDVEGGSFGIFEGEYTFYEESFPIVEGVIFDLGTVSQTLEIVVLQKEYTIAYENFYVGTNGNDTFTMTTRQVSVDGMAGADVITGNALDNVILGGAGNDTVFARSGNDTLRGGADDDILHGEDGDDALFGDAGRDLLFGGNGNDVLFGGDGTDYLTGGLGRDLFVAEVGMGEQTAKSGNLSVDIVLDFVLGEDRIDVSGFDFDPATPGNQSFEWTGHANANGAGELGMRTFGNVNAAESALGIEIDGVSGTSPYGGPVTVLLGNIDGGAPEFAIVLLNTHSISSSDIFF